MQRYRVSDGILHESIIGGLVKYADAQSELDRLHVYHMEERRSSAAMNEQLRLELDRVMGEAVKFASIVDDVNWVENTDEWQARQFLNSPEVQAWQARQKEQP